ncbi:MAG: phage capsid protein, partial [Leptospira sp.]|nr:phage capsid protein [Leptospira sp.]
FLASGIDLRSGRAILEDFFRTPNSKILVPAWISEQLELGMNWDAGELRLEDLCASKEFITGGSIDAIALDFSGEKAKMKKTVEGGVLSKTKIYTKEKTVKLEKFGTEIEFTYEAKRRVKQNLVSIALQRIGYNMSRDMSQLALKVAVEGDGNTGSAASTDTTVSSTQKYSDLLTLLISNKPTGYNWTHLVLNKAELLKILTDSTNFAPLQTLNISEDFVKTGKVMNFFNILWRTHEGMEDGNWFAYDKSSNLVCYEEKNSSMIEVDKVINQQFDQTAISVYTGFSKLMNQASFLKTKHS